MQEIRCTSSRRVEILDSTLRDGAQGEGISFSVQDKLHIVRLLDQFGVSYIEAGNPSSNPKEQDFFKKVREIPLQHARLCAFGSTHRPRIPAAQDEGLRCLVRAQTPVVSVFGKAWDFHVHHVLGVSLSENLDLVAGTIRFLKEQGREVIFDAEHAFDGYRSNAAYTIEVLRAAAAGGADCITLCDTNGGTLPDAVREIFAAVRKAFPAMRLAIHAHDDIGCAVASSMAAVFAGANQVQGTMIGYGERCGNTDLGTLIPNLQLKCGIPCDGRLEELVSISASIAEISNVRLRNNKPYVGKSAFAHKGGMHIDGVEKDASTFEHIQPELVGNQRRFLMSEVSGRTNILAKVRRFDGTLSKNSPEISEITQKVKEMEHEGYQYEGADASFELLVRRILKKEKPRFRVLLYKTVDDFPAQGGVYNACATIQIEVDGRTEITAALGNGPVNALDIAMRKALCVFYPRLQSMHLTDFKVRVIEANSTTAANVRVLIESTDGRTSWTTVGVSFDVIDASFQALSDSFEYYLSAAHAHL